MYIKYGARIGHNTNTLRYWGSAGWIYHSNSKPVAETKNIENGDVVGCEWETIEYERSSCIICKFIDLFYRQNVTRPSRCVDDLWEQMAYFQQ